MKPLVSTKGKTAQLRHELPHRVYDTKVYPVKSHKGSSICLYGHENGVRILWRGGRPLKQVAPPEVQPAKPRKVNGTSTDVIMIDDSDDEAQPAKSSSKPLEEAEFEDEEEELDPDEPYPTFIQQLDLALNTEAFHIAVPRIPAISALQPGDSLPAIFKSRMIFSVACADYSVRIINLPINPPSAATRKEGRWSEQIIKISSHTGHQSIPTAISMSWTSNDEPQSGEAPEEEDEIDVGEDESAATPRRKARRKQSRSRSAHRGDRGGWDLLLASYSVDFGGLLRIWRFPLGGEGSEDSISAPHPLLAYQTVYLRSAVSRIAFNTALYPRKRHSQLLIADSSGVARIYDPFASSNRKSRNAHLASSPQEYGVFTAQFRTEFEISKNNLATVPALARRKPILDAAWALDGRSIVGLLADGEWGIWDIDRSGPKPPSDPAAFSIRGYVGSSGQSGSSISAGTPKTRNTRSTLAPMTPNTRRTKEENLFHGAATSSSGPPRGGISVASLESPSGGISEDSVIIWYNNEAYRIPNLAQFWSRSTAGRGSLQGPGISRLQGLPLHGEAITALDQFGTSAKEARMAIPRDILVAAEHRLIITTTTNTRIGQDLGAVFEKEREEEEQARKADQALLAQGELDLGGMDRLLEEMGGREEGQQRSGLLFGNPRKVLFASSTN